MRKLTQVVTLLVLALWAMAAMHCKLEGLPGFDFLKSCCFVDAEPSSSPSNHCDSDGCGAVENGDYRAEERTDSAPQPELILVQLTPLMEVPPPAAVPTRSDIVSDAPPDLPKAWQFYLRAALPPRAPSLAA